MPELRMDPIKQRWVIIAVERARRPEDFQMPPEEKKLHACPFCYGNEDKTPPEVFAIRPSGSSPNTSGWRVRVTPNKYPALRIEGELAREGMGIFDRMSGIGAHEVVIENPDHNRSLADLSIEEIRDVLLAYRERIKDLRRDQRFRYVLVFKNHRSAAGASLSHSHSQIIATPVTPFIVIQELRAAQEHYLKKERCIFCDIIKQELAIGRRVVRADDDYLLWTPFASCFPFEVWLFPLKHRHDFALLTDDELMVLARAMKDMLLRIKLVLNDPPYNFVLHTCPSLTPRPGKPHYWGTIEYDYHWHLELVPRLTKIAGFEWGTGFYINPTPPEVAAEELKKIKIEL
ncbi:MAG: galactose-1-phosphate uridylyltransferase [Aquificota bacterium]|nr:MAG: galactose-1-phosphate uridylyltransferase [Aquificota bacterium]